MANINEEVFINLVEPYQDGWYRYALMMTSDEDFVKDCLQDLMEVLWNKQSKLGAIRNLNGYGFIVIRNSCFKFIERRKLKREIDDEVLGGNTQSDIYNKTQFPDKFQILWDLSIRLPEKQKEIFVLKDLEGLSFKEIEKITGFTNQNLRTNLSLAQNKFVKCTKGHLRMNNRAERREIEKNYLSAMEDGKTDELLNELKDSDSYYAKLLMFKTEYQGLPMPAQEFNPYKKAFAKRRKFLNTVLFERIAAILIVFLSSAIMIYFYFQDFKANSDKSGIMAYESAENLHERFMVLEKVQRQVMEMSRAEWLSLLNTENNPNLKIYIIDILATDYKIEKDELEELIQKETNPLLKNTLAKLQ